MQEACDGLTETEHILHNVWMKLLGQDNIDIDDDFFEMGGNSLHAIRMVTAIREAYGKQASQDASIALSPFDVFSNPTITSF